MTRRTTRGTRTIAILVSMFSAAAAAQYSTPPPRTDIPQGNAQQPAPKAVAAASRADVLGAAACLAERDAAAADALLATSPYSSDEREHAIRLLRAAARCAGQSGPIATSALLLRGAVAETLYETRFAQAPAPRTPPAAAAAFHRASDLASRDDAAFLTVEFDLAQCTVPTQSQLVRALLATEPGSEAEQTALSALYPTFGSCVPAGTQLRVDRGSIRAMLAESLYRWSVVQRDGPASPWAAQP